MSLFNSISKREDGCWDWLGAFSKKRKPVVQTPKGRYCVRAILYKPKLARTGLVSRCGNEKCVNPNHLVKRKPSNLIHGMRHTRVYRIWKAMNTRCSNPNSDDFDDYMGRGILVCDEWRHSFDQFYKDMGEPTTPKHCIDRIDNNKGYSKANCRWATQKENANNRRSSLIITWNGKTKTVIQWAETIGVGPSTLYGRLRVGWSVERALTEPAHKKFATKTIQPNQ